MRRAPRAERIRIGEYGGIPCARIPDNGGGGVGGCRLPHDEEDCKLGLLLEYWWCHISAPTCDSSGRYFTYDNGPFILRTLEGDAVHPATPCEANGPCIGDVELPSVATELLLRTFRCSGEISSLPKVLASVDPEVEVRDGTRRMERG